MNTAKSVTRECGPPDDHFCDERRQRKDPVRWEEPGTFWLWAWPELLDWPADISWLFSPPSDRHRWPGDLWGVDASGELLIIETKSTLSSQDPLEDFVPFQAKLFSGQRQLSFEEIMIKWEGHLRDERLFLTDSTDALRDGSGTLSKRPGIVPYSWKRLATWRWRELYLDRIVPFIMNPTYESSVKSWLALWAKRGYHDPHYIALFTVLEGKRARFSNNGKASCNALVSNTLENHVHAYSVECTPGQGDRLNITCKAIELPN